MAKRQNKQKKQRKQNQITKLPKMWEDMEQPEISYRVCRNVNLYNLSVNTLPASTKVKYIITYVITLRPRYLIHITNTYLYLHKEI